MQSKKNIAFFKYIYKVIAKGDLKELHKIHLIPIHTVSRCFTYRLLKKTQSTSVYPA